MTTWETELMEEEARNAQWEELNAPDPFEKQMRDAALEMRLAIEQIGKAEDYLSDAIASVSETPMEEKVAALLEAMEDLECEIKFLQEKYRNGERE